MKAYLKITTWADSLRGASHYYGMLRVGGEDVSVEHSLTAVQAKRMNKDDARMNNIFRRWKVGDETGRFFSEAEVYEAAVAIVSKSHPEVTMLLKGESCVLDPQPVLIGPEPLKTELNKLVAEAVANDGWEGDDDVMNDISKRWDALMKQFDNPLPLAVGDDVHDTREITYPFAPGKPSPGHYSVFGKVVAVTSDAFRVQWAASPKDGTDEYTMGYDWAFLGQGIDKVTENPT